MCNQGTLCCLFFNLGGGNYERGFGNDVLRRKEVPLGKILLDIICGPSKPTMLFFLLPKGSNDEQGATYNWSGERSKQRYLPCEITSSWQDKKDF